MSGFDDRKDAFENKFAHDSELEFKAQARRNKLLGLWAADKLNKKDDDADAYAKEVVISDFEEPGDDDVLRKVLGDFEAAGLDITKDRIRLEMDKLMAEARKQVFEEK